jgi:DNA-binding transcriptional regulator GbsR (MarR family)
MGIKSGLKSINHFIGQYAFVLLLVGAAVYYFLNQDGNIVGPRFSNEIAQSLSYGNESMDASLAYDSRSPMASRAKSAVNDMIRPPVVRAQGFDPEALSDRKIIKNGSLQLEVADTEESLAIVEAEILNQDAYVTHQDSWEVRRGTLAYNLTIRVPAENLEILSENLEKIGLKKSENFSTADITAQYRDTANRIQNLESRRDRLRELMERETETITDVLEIDRELANVQDELDQLNTTQKNRDTDVAYSTLQLTLNPQPEIGDFSSPDWNLQASWKTAVNDFIFDARDVVDKLIRAFVYTPIWLPLLLILWGVKRLIFGGPKKEKKAKK